MPVTEFQLKIAQLLSINKTPESPLAGGGALPRWVVYIIRSVKKHS